MKKRTILLIVVMVISVGFSSGCNEQLGETGAITISGPDGISITLDPDSPNSEVNFEIKKIEINMTPNLPEWADEINLLYDFSVDRSIKGEVTIKIPIPNLELAVIGHYYDNKWDVLLFEEDNGKAVVEVDNLSYFAWFDVSNIADKITDFLTLRWMDKVPNIISDPHIDVDESGSFDFISGSAQLMDGNEVEITIYNEGPVHLQVYPTNYPEKSFELIKTGIYTYEEYTILEPRSSATWTTQLVVDESVTFEAYFSNSATLALVGDIIPYGRLARGVVEGALFAKNGREMKWKDVKGLLIIPTIAEAVKTIEGTVEMPESLLETGSIVFTRVESDEEEKFTIMPDGVKVTGDIDKIQVIQYETSTEAWTHNPWAGSAWRKQSDGFVFLTDPDLVNNQRHRVNGTVQNIAEEDLKAIWITIDFYDSRGNHVGPNYLTQKKIAITEFKKGEIRDFDFYHQKYINSDPDYKSATTFTLTLEDVSHIYP